jgi:hypothetical protein
MPALLDPKKLACFIRVVAQKLNIATRLVQFLLSGWLMRVKLICCLARISQQRWLLVFSPR